MSHKPNAVPVLQEGTVYTIILDNGRKVHDVIYHACVASGKSYFAKGDKFSQEEEGNLRAQLLQKEVRIAELEKELASAQAEALRAYKLLVDTVHQGLKVQDQEILKQSDAEEPLNKNQAPEK